MMDKELSYCYPQQTESSTLFIPISTSWESENHLDGLVSQDFQINPAQRPKIQTYLWNDLAAEYDAEHLCQRLQQNGDSFSPEFMAFERVWRKDELNHYQGLSLIYSTAFGLPLDQIRAKVTARSADFIALEPYLSDEFKLTLLLAYDELVTARAYRADFAMYEQLGGRKLLSWVRQVAIDEVNHYANCLKLLRLKHKARFGEASQLLQKFVELSLSTENYQCTFVMQHENLADQPQKLYDCANTIEYLISRH